MKQLQSERVDRAALPHEGVVHTIDQPLERLQAARVAMVMVAVAAAFMSPQRAFGGWPLKTPAQVLLGFGATYSSSDGGSSTHRGIDLAASAGAPVCSPATGRVSFAGRVPGPGGGSVIAVTVSGANGSITVLPLASTVATSGAEITEGDVIGVLAAVGDGSSSVSHLHVGARSGDLYVDPLSVMEPPTAADPEARETPQTNPPIVTQPVKTPVPAGVTPDGAAAGVGPTPLPTSGSSIRLGETEALGVGRGETASQESRALAGSKVAPGVEIAGAEHGSALGDTRFASASEALSGVLGGGLRDGSGSGLRVGALMDGAQRIFAQALQLGARLLVAVLAAIGALWPIWRSEKRKGESQLSVRPSDDDVAAVAGQW